MGMISNHIRQQWRTAAALNDGPDGDGDCYPVAAKLVCYDDGYKDGKVCHGMVTGQGSVEGIRFGHAWVEITRGGRIYCVDQSNGNNVVMAQGMYYSIGKIDASTVMRYTRDEAMSKIAKTHHWGPWE